MIPATSVSRTPSSEMPTSGISIDKVTQQLEDEGVEKLNKQFDKLTETLATTSPRPAREVP